MANHPSAEKRNRQTQRRTEVNTARMSRLRTFVKKVETAIASGDKNAAKEAFAAAERPAVIVGPGALAAGGLGAALALVEPLGLIRDGWNGFNVLHTSASRMASLILGYAQAGGIADIEAAAPELVLLLGADEVAADRFAGAFQVNVRKHL